MMLSIDGNMIRMSNKTGLSMDVTLGLDNLG